MAEVSVLGRLDPIAVTVAVMTAGAFALRLSQVLDQSLFGDEVWTYQDVVGRSLGSVLRNVHTGAENSPPLFFAVVWLFAKIGDPSVWIRVPSLVLGTATIPLVYLLGRETIGRIPGLVGAAIIAVSPFAIYYGVEARPYTTVAFFVALSSLALVKAVRTSKLSWWLLYAIASAAAVYSHYTALFPLAVQGAWSLWACRDRLRWPLLANCLVALLYVPWLPHVRGKALSLFAAFEPLTPHHVLADMARLIPGYPYGSLAAIPTYAGLAVVGGFACVGLVAAGLRWRDRRDVRTTTTGLPGGPVLIAALALATPLGVLLYSIIGTDIWNARVQYASLPAAALTLGALLWSVPRVGGPVAVAAVLATLIAGTVRSLGPSYARPPYNSVASYLDRVAAPRDPVILDPLTWGITIPFEKRHRVVSYTPAWPRSVAANETAYAAYADNMVLFLGIKMQAPRGFELVTQRHYSSPVWGFTLLSYRRVPASPRTP